MKIDRKTVWGIVSPDGVLWPLVRDEFGAWSAFFKDNAHRCPLATAIKAYEAIGYKLCEFTIELKDQPTSGETKGAE